MESSTKNPMCLFVHYTQIRKRRAAPCVHFHLRVVGVSFRTMSFSSGRPNMERSPIKTTEKRSTPKKTRPIFVPNTSLSPLPWVSLVESTSPRSVCVKRGHCKMCCWRRSLGRELGVRNWGLRASVGSDS